jgi:5-methylcytosine-specific restriction endonuclease McrA
VRKAAWQRAYYRRNREKVLARGRAASKRRREVKREEVLAREAGYRAKNADRIRAYKRDWVRQKRARMSASEVDALRARRRKYKPKDPAAARERRRVYRETHRDQISRYNAQWYRDNKIKVLERKRSMYFADPGAARAQGRIRRGTRRARERQGGGSYTTAEWRALVENYGGRCAYCGTITEKLEVDHRVPLSLGGANTIDNILPACADCNRRKHTMTESDFREREARRGLLEDSVRYAA